MSYQQYNSWLKEQTLSRLNSEYDQNVKNAQAAESERSRAAWVKMAELTKLELLRRGE